MAANPKAPRRYTLSSADWTSTIVFDGIALEEAFQRINGTRKSLTWFCGGMTDLWHDNSPQDALLQLTKAVRSVGMSVALGGTPQTLVFVTKRPANLLKWQREYFPAGLPPWVWVLCSVCCQADADRMLDSMVSVEGHIAMHAEPLLGPLDVSRWLPGPLARQRRFGLQGIIAGPENGPQARPCDPDWLRSLRDQASAAGIPYFLKSGLPLDGVEYSETPWSPR